MSERKGNLRHGLLVRTVAMGLAASASISAESAAIAQQAVAINIPEQRASDAITRLARQTGTQILFDHAQLRRIRSRPVNATVSPAEALRIMLEGSAFEVAQTPSGALVIRPTAAQRPASSPTDTEVAAQSRTQQTDASSVEQQSSSPAIVVTGTRIQGQQVRPIPRIEFDREDVQDSGAFTTEEFMRTIPQNFGGGRNAVAAPASESFDNVANNARITTVNLRGLAPGATLSLVNGRRMAPVGLGGDFDISVIPASAIERIDIVPDGSSAIYGSDAIAGVVNFVLRDSLRGAESSIQYGMADDSGFDQLRVGQAVGLGWGSGSATVSYEYFDQDALTADERAYAQPLVPDSNLVDPSRRHSVLGSIRQDVGERVSIAVDALYSDRRGMTTFTFFPGFTQDYRVEYFSVAPTITFAATPRLNLEIGAVHGRADEEIVSDFDGFRDPFGAENSFTSADLVVRGDPFRLPGGRANLVVGLAGRWEQQEGTGLAASPRKEREVLAAFGELLIPLFGDDFQPLGIAEAELLLALRHEDYSDFGSTTNPKVGLAISPTPALTLRGSYSTSFKAPRQSANPGSEFLLITRLPNPITGQQQLVVINGGTVPDLMPEEAESWTVGFDWEPARNIAINATYYDIRFDGRIASPAASAPAMLAAPDIYGAFINSDPGAAFVGALLDRIPRVINLAGPFQPGDVDAIVDFRVTNIASTRTRGIDVNIAVSRETGIGLLAGRLNLNHVFQFDNRALPGGPVSDDLDTLFRPLDFRLRGELSWARRGAQAGIAVNYSDSYENRTAVPTERVDAYATVDARFSYTFPSGAAFALRNLSLFANIRNIFDEDPPFVSTGIEGLAYDGANADPFGRLISIGIRKRW